ncbi:hypothetical protein ACFOU0_04715 [Salinicoccus sesuvii]|uniref:Uncharacterized protein n=1 Tax=Salinicoccus sesuvii TaxID=868281 RepID=A0ABV7N5T1_9STAP
MIRVNNLKNQFKFMFYHFVNELDSAEKTTNKYRLRGELPFKKIKFDKYDKFRTQSFFYFTRLNNIVGDSQNHSVSYKMLRKRIEKELDIELPKINQGSKEIINTFYNQRNWTVHFTKYELQAELDLNPSRYDDHRHTVGRPKYVTRELYLDLIHSNWSEINKARIIRNLILQDYFKLFGEYPQIHRNKGYTIDLSSLEKAERSFEYSKKKP